MKKQLFTLLILSFSLILAACGHAEAEPLQPAWPTPVAAQPAPLPTPLPKISQDDVLVAESASVAMINDADAFTETEPDEAATIAVVNETNQAQTFVAGKSTANNSATLVGNILSVANLSRVTDGQITSSAVNVRQGPGTNYDTLDVVQLGQVVDVLATNSKRDWVLVNISHKTNRNGWVSLDYLDLFNPVDTLPVVLSSPPDKAIPARQVAQMFLVREGQTLQTASWEQNTDYQPVEASYE